MLKLVAKLLSNLRKLTSGEYLQMYLSSLAFYSFSSEAQSALLCFALFFRES
jgi:hypothetical protein